MINQKKIEKAVREILQAIGEDPDREGLKETPKRVAALYADLFSGLAVDPGRELTLFQQGEHEEMVMLKDIPFYSICEHHLVPFVGRAHVVYIPTKGRITGLSKLIRVVEGYAKRPQVQERLTSEVADCLMAKLKPQGVLVVIEAEHLCMSMRGVKKPGTKAVTSAVRGIFQRDAKARSEALALIK
ncbi:MAG: GTP cyclohydrolase I FolE [Candidatus Margulisiibacteriota bacterium]